MKRGSKRRWAAVFAALSWLGLAGGAAAQEAGDRPCDMRRIAGMPEFTFEEMQRENAALEEAGLAQSDEMRVLEVEHLVQIAIEGGLEGARAEQMRAILADDLATRRAVLAMRRGQEIDMDEMVERGREAGRVRDQRLTGLLGDDGFAALDWDEARVRADQEYMSRPPCDMTSITPACPLVGNGTPRRQCQ